MCALQVWWDTCDHPKMFVDAHDTQKKFGDAQVMLASVTQVFRAIKMQIGLLTPYGNSQSPWPQLNPLTLF